MIPWSDSNREDTQELASSYDDLPLWSASFGLTLLEKAPLRGIRAALDIGCGTGFPLVELAERLGLQARVAGLDPWEKALERARYKCKCRGVGNVETVVGRAERMPFTDGSFDLVVSNNGLNNVENADEALAECRRVSRKGAKLVMTVNLPGTMREFYDVYRSLLSERFGSGAVERLDAHIREKRQSLEEWRARLARARYAVEEVLEREFSMRYSDGGALFHHSFIRIAFLDAWTKIVGPEEVDPVFKELTRRLDSEATRRGDITLTVPYFCAVAHPQD